jgi:hypothetical protein
MNVSKKEPGDRAWQIRGTNPCVGENFRSGLYQPWSPLRILYNGWGNLRKGDHLGDRGVDWRIILKWIFEKRYGGWTGSICFRIEIGGGFL